MKQITIEGKVYDIDCNSFTQVQYKSFFKTGMIKDMQTIKEYLIKQTIVSKQITEVEPDLNEAQKLSKVADYMSDDIDEYLIKVTQIAWILIYSANEKIEDYKTWLKSIKKFKIDADWIVEVTEFAVDCFC